MSPQWRSGAQLAADEQARRVARTAQAEANAGAQQATQAQRAAQAQQVVHARQGAAIAQRLTARTSPTPPGTSAGSMAMRGGESSGAAGPTYPAAALRGDAAMVRTAII